MKNKKGEQMNNRQSQTMNRREFLAGTLAAGGTAALGGCKTTAVSSSPDLPPIENRGKIPYRVFWTWDHSTNWTMNVPGEQNCGVQNEYTKKPGMFEIDYKRAVDWCAEHGMHGVGIVGMLRDRHGGVDAARRLCGYAREKGVRIYLIAGLFSYGGIYYEGNSPWSLNEAFKKHPEWIGRKKDGSPVLHQGTGAGGSKCDPQGCPSNPELRNYVFDSLDWLFKTIPELGGIQMEAGDCGVCQCDACRARRGQNAGTGKWSSIEDMAIVYPDAAEAIRSRTKDAWVICETYQHFLEEQPMKVFRADNPDPNVQKLLAMPESTIWQWKCDPQIRGFKPWDENDRMLPAMRKFHHIMRAHTGSQWRDGRFTFGVDLIRRQCRLSFTSGIDCVSMFGENSPFYANSEFNYLALTYFAEHPLATLDHFIRDEMAPRLGGWEAACRWTKLCDIHREGSGIPAAIDEITKIASGLSGDIEARRRWIQLACWLESHRFESQFWPGQKDYDYYYDPWGVKIP